MKFTSAFIQEIKSTLVNDLPGEDAHLLMSPLGRGKSSEALAFAKNIKYAAVAVILHHESDELQIILTQRASYDGIHGGQISFPGGRKDENDQNTIQTAIRESKEEIDLDLSDLHYLGKLTDVYIPVSNFLVYPEVFYLESLNELQPNYEVAEIFNVTIKELLDEKNVSTMEVKVGDNLHLKVPCFSIKGKNIWGATAIILSELKVLVQKKKWL